MKNKLFLSLSILTATFSMSAASLADGSLIINSAKSMIPTTEMFTKPSELTFKALNAANSVKSVVTLPRVINAAKVGIFAGMAGYVYTQYQKDQAAQKPELSRFERAQAYVANTRVAQALVSAGSFVKANTYDRSLFGYENGGKYATAGAGVVAVAGE